MKVLYICKSLPHSFQGGIQTHVWKISEYMLRLGHDVTILTAGSWMKGEKCYNIEGRHIIAIPYLPMRRQPILPLFLEELSFNRAVNRWLSKNISLVGERHKDNFDLIHMQGRSGFTFPKNKNTIPIITTFHGLISVENSKSNKRGIQKFLHEQWANYFEKNVLLNSDAIIAVSQEMQQEIAHILPQINPKITIVANGVDVRNTHLDIRSSLHNKVATLLFVGRLDRIKGVFNLIEAFKNVRSDIQLMIIGDGKERQNLEKAIVTEGLSTRVQLLGAMPNESVLQKITECDALILPSFHETQGIVLLEANAQGKPVIASNINGIKEVVTHGYNGLLCDPYNPLHIAETINHLFADPDLMLKIGKNGRARVIEKFDWSHIAQQTEMLYCQVLENFRTGKAKIISVSQKPIQPSFQNCVHEKA